MTDVLQEICPKNPLFLDIGRGKGGNPRAGDKS
jgi:hypothetical protein